MRVAVAPGKAQDVLKRSSAKAALEMVRPLFLEDNMYIKDCEDKSLKEGNRYIRVAARGSAEIDAIVEALKRIVGSGATRPRAASSITRATP